MGRGKSKAALARDNMPLCTYGAACARKDCIFRHAAPKKPPASAEDGDSEPQNVCMAYVAGACSFGRRCRNLHPPDDEVEAIRQSCALRKCMYGHGCTNPLCLFAHPEDPAVAAEREAERALERLALQEPLGAGAPSVPWVDKVDNLLPERARPPVALAPTPAPLPLHRPPQSAGSGAQPSNAAATPGLCADVRIPEGLWIDTARRDPEAFHERDPLARFARVNAAHALPTVLDLHFQSAASFAAVLDATLHRTLAVHGEAWVLTGSGHHVPSASHQARGGVLFEAVGQYLSGRAGGADGQHLRFAAAGDRNGHYGAYKVWTVAA